MSSGSTARRLITRNRALLACLECRRRKLRCDRASPCSACARRGDPESCTYERPGNDLEHERQRRVQAEARLEHLEQLVQRLAREQSAAEPLIDAPSQSMAGHLVTSTSRTIAQWTGVHESSKAAPKVTSSEEFVYSGSTHWSAMLDDIKQLRFAITDGIVNVIDSEPIDTGAENGTHILLGMAPALPLDQVLATFLPTRHEADRLTSSYFRAKAVNAPFIHSSQFRRLYQAFWANPLNTPPLWTSMFFTVCYVSTNVLTMGKGKTPTEEGFAIAAAHCLAIGQYYRPKRFAVESLLLYIHSQCVTNLDLPNETSVLMGLLVRLATNMGYHRDPDTFKLSIFEREMRRRTWCQCLQLEMLISFYYGLPPGIQSLTCDTRPPRNLFDFDIDEDSTKLPPERPEAEATSILFYISKHRFMAVFERILRHMLITATNANSECDVDLLDMELRDVAAAVPEILRPRPMTESIVDTPDVIVTRLCVFLLHQKCLCVLHRVHVVRGRVESIRICHESSANIVRTLLDAYEEFQPGGQTEISRWFMSSLSWHDFLLGVMALCLVICAASHYEHEIDRTSIISLLCRARPICLELSQSSRDTRKVCVLIDATIARFGQEDDPSSISSLSPGLTSLTESRTEPTPTAEDWISNDFSMKSMSDPSWAYLEEFLNLPSDDSMLDIVEGMDRPRCPVA